MKIESTIHGMTFKAETTITYHNNSLANSHVEQRLQESYRDFLEATKAILETKSERTTFEEF